MSGIPGVAAKIGVIGCGKMARSLAQGALVNYVDRHSTELYFYDRHSDRSKTLASDCLDRLSALVQQRLSQQTTAEPYKGVSLPNICSLNSLSELIEAGARTMLLAVPPGEAKNIGTELQTLCGQESNLLIISILAGKKLSQLKEFFPGAKIVRLMPNHAAGIVKEGIISACTDDPETKNLVDELFRGNTTVFWIPEKQMNAMTVAGASAPAFAALLIEAMIDGAITIGLSPELARQVALQMLAGTVNLLQQEALSPQQLRHLVSTPRGVTVDGLRELEKASVRGAIIDGYLASIEKIEKIEKDS